MEKGKEMTRDALTDANVIIQRGFDARAVANQLLYFARMDEKWFTPLQVLKLVYYCQGWALARLDTKLFRQDIQAWRYGPVVRDVYNEVRVYVDGPVSNDIKADRANFSGEEQWLMREVYRLYGNMRGVELITLTHLPGSPWDQIWSHRRSDHDVIPVEMIREYFIDLDRISNR